MTGPEITMPVFLRVGDTPEAEVATVSGTSSEEIIAEVVAVLRKVADHMETCTGERP